VTTESVASGNRLDSIEALRGVAALMIVIYHFVELGQFPIPPALGFVRSHFGLGVPLFYVLSGFVLAWGYAERLALGRGEAVKFYVRRFFRIAPLFYLTMVCWRAMGSLLWSWPANIRSVLLNITFLFGLVPGEHESLVMAGWSIGIEMLLYAVFPILVILCASVRVTLVALLLSCIAGQATNSALASAGLKSFAYMNLVTHMPFFLSGILTFRVWQARWFRRSSWGGGLALVAAGAVGSMFVANPGLFFGNAYIDLLGMPLYVWAIIFGLLIYASCTLSIPGFGDGLLRRVGRMSFSTYLLHPIVIVALIKSGVIVQLGRLDPWTGVAMGLSLTILLVVAISSFTYRYVEVPGIALGNRLIRSRLPRNVA